MTTPAYNLKNVSSVDLLKELSARGGHPGALADAALLCIKKSEDYNGSFSLDMHSIDRSHYFPFGLSSHAHMIHTKSSRFVSLARNKLDGKPCNFEGLHDTALDLINYCGFFIADKNMKSEDWE